MSHMGTGPIPRRLTLLAALFIMFLTAGSSLAANRVITIYMHGTGHMQEDWVSPWTGAASVSKHENLLSLLYDNDASETIVKTGFNDVYCVPSASRLVTDVATTRGALHYKYVLDGLGTPDCGIEKAEPDTGVRKWTYAVSEALLAIREVIAVNNNAQDTYSLNLLGFSRGGILTMLTARAIVNATDLNDRVNTINILAFDPVPGGWNPIGKFKEDFKLDPKVAEYVGIYAEHEMTYQFEPVVPEIESTSATRDLMVRVPGLHEGALVTEGDCFPTCALAQVMRFFAEQLLRSPAWGNVPIGNASTMTESRFRALVDPMWTLNYSFLLNQTIMASQFSWLLPCHTDVGIRATTPSEWRRLDKRLCFQAPNRHEPAHWDWCGWINEDWVFWLQDKVQRFESDDWHELNTLRKDVKPPVVGALAAVTVECGEAVPFPTADDVGSPPVEVTTSSPISYTGPGTYAINWTFKDQVLNAINHNQSVTVRDTTKPVIVAPSFTELTSAGCVAIIEDARLGTATDSCEGTVALTRSGVPAGNSFPIGTTTITITATDQAGNTATTSQDITVIDQAAPSIALNGPAELAVECHDSYADPGAQAADSCTGDLTSAITVTGAVDVNTPGTYVVTYNVADASGNAATPVTRTVHVKDTAAPSIALNDAAETTIECHAAYTDPGAQATDSCAGDLTSAITVIGAVDVNTPGTYVLTYNVADASGNAAAPATRTVHVLDTAAPSITLNGAAAMTLECHSSYNDPGALASDSCAGDLTSAITVKGSADVNTPGRYAIEYAVADPSGNVATAVRTIIVQDTAPPVMTGCVPAKQVAGCSAAVPDFTAEVVASDTCSGSVLRVSQSPAPGTIAVIGAHPVTITVSDSTGNTATCTTTFTVFNNPPALTTNGPWSVVEGSAVTLSATAIDPDGGSVEVAWDLDADGVFETTGLSVLFAGNEGPGTYAIAVRASDSCGFVTTALANLSVTNAAPVLGAIIGPVAPVSIGTALTFSAPFTDPGTRDSHTGTWNWDDGSTSPAAINGGLAAGSHMFAAAGVYRVALELTDDDGGSDSGAFEYAIVFDAAAGFVTGGGWIASPAGAYGADALLSGKTNFGFNAKYQEASVPQGETAFHFAAAGLTFHSSANQWLIVTGAKAQLKGSGTIAGAGHYEFSLTVVDGDAANGGGKDRIRMKIWERDSGMVVYDNLRGAPDDVDVTALQEIGGGNITVHVK